MEIEEGTGLSDDWERLGVTEALSAGARDGG